MENTKWLIWSIEHNGWWRDGHRGYTQNIEQAGKYDYEESCRIVKGANYAITLPQRVGEKYSEKYDIPNEAMILLTPELEKKISE